MFLNIKNKWEELTGKQNPDISVIIPFFNTEEYLRTSLESVITQRDILLEVILVDDGSTDCSGDIAKEYAEKHENISLYETPNRGPGYARNYGVQFASGRYIAFVDADDILVPDIYSRMLRSADNNNADMCLCNAARFNSKAIWGSSLHNKAYNHYRTVTNIKETTELVYDTCAWNKLIRKDFYNRSSLIFPEGIVYEDILFNIRAHLESNKVVMLAETGYLWRVRDEENNPSLTQNYYSRKNIEDRLNVAREMAEMANDETLPTDLRKAIFLKLLEIDMGVILNATMRISEEESKRNFEEVSSFIDKYINMESINSLSIADAQRFKLVQDGDIQGYKKLMDYIKNHYNLAHVEERQGTLIAHLPDELFAIEKRSFNDEFARAQRRIWIDNIAITEEGISIYAHIYMWRYNMSKEEDQAIEVQLINEENNEVVKLNTEPHETRHLTNQFGTLEDTFSGEKHHYNYDATGFKFSVGFDTFDQLENNQIKKYSVVLSYKDRIFNGVQILKGADDKIIKRYETISIKTKGGSIAVNFGIQKELQFIVCR